MKQLDLFARTPLLEIGKAYRFVYGYNNQYLIDYYIANMEYNGDPWSPYVSISYFGITENKIPSMKDSIHDCGSYIWQKGYSDNIEVAYRFPTNNYHELTGSALIDFISKLRDKNIRTKFNLPLFTRE